MAAFGLAGAVVAGAFLLRSGPLADPGPVHVHGLGINPADGTLFIATHTGLYRLREGERESERVSDLQQDTMGFTIVGPNRFLGSGHPDLREARDKNLPPHLGLIQSTNAGESWENVSLLGEADFHVLRFADERVYGYDASNNRLLASDDVGESWKELEKPGPVLDLAVDPTDARHIIISSVGGPQEGLFSSSDGGGSWTRVNEAVGLLAWPMRLFVIEGRGEVFVSGDGGRHLQRRGEIGGQPAALLAQGAEELYAALHDGTIKRSTNGGSDWQLRSIP